MMKKLLLCMSVALLSSQAFAAEYVCKVYCVGPDGSTQVRVEASSASEAAKLIDRQSDQVCQAADFRASTSSTMSASQCERD
jgi:hypothetical protein